MNCVVCKKETSSLMKGVPCCPLCRKTVVQKRDEMLEEKKRLHDIMNGTLDQNPKEHIKIFQESPDGTLRNALIKCEIERNVLNVTKKEK